MNVQTVDIPIDVEVKCCGESCGRSTRIVLNPVTKKITHLVVKQRSFPFSERLVPISLVKESTPRMIRLRCDAAELEAMDKFVEKEFIRSAQTRIVGDSFLMWPYAYTTSDYVPRHHEQIPAGELALRRGAHVRTRDGQVGRVDEFMVNQHDDHITHLVMREGHLWDQRDVTIPVSCIEHIDHDAVYLNIDKASIAALPALRIPH